MASFPLTSSILVSRTYLPMAQWVRLCLQCRRWWFDPWVRKIPWRMRWQPTPRFSPGESHGQRNPAAYSPWGRESWTQLKQLSAQTCILISRACLTPSLYDSLYLFLLQKKTQSLWNIVAAIVSKICFITSGGWQIFFPSYWHCEFLATLYNQHLSLQWK